MIATGTLIAVRLTRTVSNMDMVLAEIALVVDRKGLVPLRGGWYATQLELDTPHHTFRLSPR
jgi:hypothetical protein